MIEVINDWVNGVKSDILANYDSMGFRASGQFEEDLSSEINEGEGKVNIKIKGSYYTYWLENGRKPGKLPPIDAIEQWIEDKGIQSELSKDRLAWAIAKSMQKKGTIKRPGLVSNVITKERIDELIKSVGFAFLNDVKSDVLLSIKI